MSFVWRDLFGHLSTTEWGAGGVGSPEEERQENL